MASLHAGRHPAQEAAAAHGKEQLPASGQGGWHWQGAPEQPAPSNRCSHADETSLSTPKRMRKVGWRGDQQPQVLVKPDVRRAVCLPGVL